MYSIVCSLTGKPLEAKKFDIAVGGKVTTTVHNPIAALSVWFAAFYVLNLHYHPGVAVTTEFIQR